MNRGDGFGDIYHIIWYLPGTTSVGEVRNYTEDLKRYRRIGISRGDHLLRTIIMPFLTTEWTGSGPRILVSKSFMAMPRSLREAGIWHEVGHIHCGHGLNGSVRGGTRLDGSPGIATDDGSARALEEAADRFAVLKSSPEAVKGFLEYLLRAQGPAGRRGIGRQELQYRLTAIRRQGFSSLSPDDAKNS